MRRRLQLDIDIESLDISENNQGRDLNYSEANKNLELLWIHCDKKYGRFRQRYYFKNSSIKLTTTNQSTLQATCI